MDFIARNPVTCNPKALMITFALLALIACVGISCVPIYLLGRGVFARAREYFVASEHTPSGVIQNSSIAYSLQIATFGQFFGWGAKGEFWPAMIFSAMFGGGLYLIYRLRLPMRAFMSQALERDRSVTVPGFIARQHGNDARVQLIAAILSVCAFAGLIASAAIGAASLVRPILPGSLNTTFPIACGLLGLMLLYTIPAGNSGALRSAQALLGILYFGLIGSTLIVLYMLISSAGQMPPQGMFAVTVLATCCAIVLVHRHSQYIDTSPIRSPVSGEATDIRPLGARLFRRFSWIVNVLIAVLAGTTLVFALIGLYAQGVTAVITESVSALRAETQTSISGLLALVLLPIFYPIVDTTNWLRITALEIDPNSGRHRPNPEDICTSASDVRQRQRPSVAAHMHVRNGRSTRDQHAGRRRRPAILHCAACFAAERPSGCGLSALARKRDCDGCGDEQRDVFRNFSNHSVRHYPNVLVKLGAGTGAAVQSGSREEARRNCRQQPLRGYADRLVRDK